MRAFVQELIDEVSGWPGLVTGEDPGHFHATSWWLRQRIVGHIHVASAVVDVPFSRAICDRLLFEGAAILHRYRPKSVWVSAHLRSPIDAVAARWLIRLSYVRHRARFGASSSKWLAHELSMLRPSEDLGELIRSECTSQ
jgi:Luciferase